MALRYTSRYLPRLALTITAKRGYAAATTDTPAPPPDKMSLSFAAANQTFYQSQVVKQVDVPSFSGCLGILYQHVPTLAVLRPGVVAVIEEDGKENKFFVSSGIVSILDDSTVQIIAEEAHPLENLDINIARNLLIQAQSQYLSAPTDEVKAEAEVAIEVGEALVQALQ